MDALHSYIKRVVGNVRAHPRRDLPPSLHLLSSPLPTHFNCFGVKSLVIASPQSTMNSMEAVIPYKVLLTLLLKTKEYYTREVGDNAVMEINIEKGRM